MKFLLHLFMKIKLTPLYILAFLFSVLLLHELHDWAHVLMARALAGCWGQRRFDSWDVGPCQVISNVGKAIAVLAGPLINYIFIWIGWNKMGVERTTVEKSIGLSFVFAALPLPRILGATSGGGDETNGLHLLFSHSGDNGRHHLVAIIGLVLVLALCGPALIRAF